MKSQFCEPSLIEYCQEYIFKTRENSRIHLCGHSSIFYWNSNGNLRFFFKLDNIQSCLHFLTNLGVSLEGINARDIRDGHLKSILSLFFQLSRFKQQQKQQDRDRVGSSSSTSSNQKQRQSGPASQNCVSAHPTQAHNMIQQHKSNQHISPQSSPYSRHATGNTVDPSK